MKSLYPIIESSVHYSSVWSFGDPTSLQSFTSEIHFALELHFGDSLRFGASLRRFASLRSFTSELSAEKLPFSASIVMSSGSTIVSCPDPTHSNEEKGLSIDLVLFEQFLQNSGKPIRIIPCDLEK